MGTYRPLRLIAKGERADVLLAADGDGGLVVSKRLTAASRDPAALARLRREAEAAAALDHPNIARIRELLEEAGDVAVIMEYVSGETLHDLLRAAARTLKRVPLPVACAILDGAAAGLSRAHEAVSATGEPRPILHRGISTSNLMVGYDGRVKVVDLGLFEPVDEGRASDAGRLRARLRYRSPEQVSGGAVDHRSDLFSLGAVMWEMLTSAELFTGSNEGEIIRSIRERHIPPPSRFNPELPASLDPIVLGLLRRDVATRLPSARELRAALAGVAAPSEPEEILGRWMTSTFTSAHARRRAVEEAALAGRSQDPGQELPVAFPDPLSNPTRPSERRLRRPSPWPESLASVPHPLPFRRPRRRTPVSRSALLAVMGAAFAVPFLFVIALRGGPEGAGPVPPAPPTRDVQAPAETPAASLSQPEPEPKPEPIAEAPEDIAPPADDVSLAAEPEPQPDDAPRPEARAGISTARRHARRARRPDPGPERRPEPVIDPVEAIEPVEPVEPEAAPDDATPERPAEPGDEARGPSRRDSDTNPYVYK